MEISHLAISAAILLIAAFVVNCLLLLVIGMRLNTLEENVISAISDSYFCLPKDENTSAAEALPTAKVALASLQKNPTRAYPKPGTKFKPVHWDDGELFRRENEGED